MPKVEEKVLKTDILIVGGGVTGLNAALTARQAGQDVIIMDKAIIERSGHASGGIDHFCAYLNTGPDWDTREAYLKFTAESARGASNISVVEKVYCDELESAIKRFEEIGCPLQQSDGTFFRTQSFGQPGPWWINFNGKKFKPSLAHNVRKAGCTVLDRVFTIDLITYDGEVCGAVGFHIRQGTFYVVLAKAVILVTGGTNRLYQNPTGLSFNCWMCPADTGDGEAMAYRAGAMLSNMEYLRMTVIPRGFSAPGLNALVGLGGKFINGLGEAFMEQYDPQGMRAPRYKLVQGVIEEIKAHRGPIYIDCRHINPKDLEHLITTLSYDKDTFSDFLHQKGIDLKKDLLEIAPSEGMQGGPNELCGSGIKIDPDCASTLPGLFAGGNSADQCRSLHMAVTSGIHVGKTSTAYAAVKKDKQIAFPNKQIKVIQDRTYSNLSESRSIDWREFEEVLQRTLTEGMGPTRSAWGMESTWKTLNLLDSMKDEVRADSFHDLCRTLEVFNMLTVARCMTKAALYRTESRFGLCHNRQDYTKRDDRKWLGQVTIVRGVDNQPQPNFIPLQYD